VLARNGNIVYSGLNTSVTIDFPYNGTFWYSLSACNEYGCRSVPLAQSVVVTLPELNLPAPTGLFSNPTSKTAHTSSDTLVRLPSGLPGPLRVQRGKRTNGEKRTDLPTWLRMARVRMRRG
jgi:hypothetical protein